MTTARLAVIGGSGFYDFFEDGKEVSIDTPYGPTSAPIKVGEVAGRPVAFVPRHGRGHDFPPHLIPYQANLWALAKLGVRQVLAPCAVGGLTAASEPGQLVAPDQLIDRTSQLATYVDRGAVHAPFADPYCARLRDVLAAQPEVRVGGTMIVISGPRFSTRAESQNYAAMGADLINMTGAAEATLARELGLCYQPLALVTDVDAGVTVGEGVTTAEVFAEFAANLPRLRAAVSSWIGQVPDPEGCSCRSWTEPLEFWP